MPLRHGDHAAGVQRDVAANRQDNRSAASRRDRHVTSVGAQDHVAPVPNVTVPPPVMTAPPPTVTLPPVVQGHGTSLAHRDGAPRAHSSRFYPRQRSPVPRSNRKQERSPEMQTLRRSRPPGEDRCWQCRCIQSTWQSCRPRLLAVEGDVLIGFPRRSDGSDGTTRHKIFPFRLN